MISSVRKAERQQAAHHRRGDALHDVGARARGPEQRHEADQHGRDRHQLRAHALDRALHVRGDDVVEVADQAARLAALEGVVDVDDHHDAGLRGQPDERDDADPDRRRQPVVEQPHQPDAADERERDRQQDDQHLDEFLNCRNRAAR
jgi:hypothetical protein